MQIGIMSLFLMGFGAGAKRRRKRQRLVAKMLYRDGETTGGAVPLSSGSSGEVVLQELRRGW
jgi:hypothetical protein